MHVRNMARWKTHKKKSHADSDNSIALYGKDKNN